MMTLGEMIRELEKFSGDKLVDLYGDYPDLESFHSYRGLYSDLAFECQYQKKATVQEFLTALKGVVGKSFQGWKGGDFIMDENSDVWVSQEGHSSGKAVCQIKGKRKTVYIYTEFC